MISRRGPNITVPTHKALQLAAVVLLLRLLSTGWLRLERRCLLIGYGSAKVGGPAVARQPPS